MIEGRTPGRLRRRSEFERVYEAGRRQHGSLMTVIALQTADGGARLGVAASRKIGGAVIRNRLKRVARAIFRLNLPSANMDVVIVPKAAMANAPFDRVEAEFRRGLTSNGSAKPPKSRHPRGTGAASGL